jgi:hypothetical protein
LAHSRTTSSPAWITTAISHDLPFPGGHLQTSWDTHTAGKDGGALTTAQLVVNCTHRRRILPCAHITTQKTRHCPSLSRHLTRQYATWRGGEGTPSSSQITTATAMLSVQYRQAFKMRLGGENSGKANLHAWICRSSFQNQEVVRRRPTPMRYCLLRRWSIRLPLCRLLPSTNFLDP